MDIFRMDPTSSKRSSERPTAKLSRELARCNIDIAAM